MAAERTGEGRPAIEVCEVRKKWGDFEVLRGISFQVQPGEVVALLGPSGSGKSTLLRCIHHLETINSGRIYVNGSLIGYDERAGTLYELGVKKLSAQRARIGMTFQHFNLFRHMTALENVKLALKLVKKLDDDAATEVAMSKLAAVGMEGKSGAYPAQLSGGQQQRVAIARTIAMQPDVFLLDEPTSALDPELAQEVISTIRQLSMAGRTMMIATHDLHIVREFADRVIFMVAGIISEDTTVEKFFTSPENEEAIRFISRKNRDRQAE